jgi:hypothetical protein
MYREVRSAESIRFQNFPAIEFIESRRELMKLISSRLAWLLAQLPTFTLDSRVFVCGSYEAKRNPMFVRFALRGDFVFSSLFVDRQRGATRYISTHLSSFNLIYWKNSEIAIKIKENRPRKINKETKPVGVNKFCVLSREQSRVGDTETIESLFLSKSHKITLSRRRRRSKLFFYESEI